MADGGTRLTFLSRCMVRTCCSNDVGSFDGKGGGRIFADKHKRDSKENTLGTYLEAFCSGSGGRKVEKEREREIRGKWTQRMREWEFKGPK